jgi:hypothetical protein
MSVLRALIGAFYSRALYREVATQWSPFRAIGVLALALAFGWAAELAQLQRVGLGWARGEADAFIERLPALAIRDRQLVADPPGPHVYRLGEEEGKPFVFVLDTSDTATAFEDARLLLTRTQIVVRRNALETRSFEIARLADATGLEDGPIEKEEMRRWVRAVTRWAPIVLWPFVVLGELVYRLLHAAILAVAGMAIARSLGASLSVASAYAIGLVVLAPLTLIETAAALMHRPVRGWLAAAIAVLYLFFACQAAARSEPAAASR